MMPMLHPPMAPHAPVGQSPLVALLARHAQMQPPQMPHPGGMVQAPGAPMQVNAGGHPAGRAGHMTPFVGGAGC